MRWVEFKGEKYLFGGSSLDESGFIATQEQYQTGQCSFAHWYPKENAVNRFGKPIGTAQWSMRGRKLLDGKDETLWTAEDCARIHAEMEKQAAAVR